ncbi:hypothetical protein AAG570_012705 [Ranatra chinensis]|uniref:Ig-like domain-containing protein n=1 Tax=Ranatra chinensis TaxID=642074 RepID=A0ABD0YEM0_9HEMI
MSSHEGLTPSPLFLPRDSRCYAHLSRKPLPLSLSLASETMSSHEGLTPSQLSFRETRCYAHLSRKPLPLSLTPEKKFEVSQTKTDTDSVTVTCRAQGAYPQPNMTLFKSPDKKNSGGVEVTRDSLGRKRVTSHINELRAGDEIPKRL